MGDPDLHTLSPTFECVTNDQDVDDDGYTAQINYAKQLTVLCRQRPSVDDAGG